MNILFLIFFSILSLGAQDLSIQKKVSISDNKSAGQALNPKLINFVNVNNTKDLKKIIQSEKIDVNAQDSTGITLLHFAAVKKNYQSIKALIELGANCMIQDLSKTSPVHIMIRNCDVKSFKLISNKIDNIDLQNNDGYSFLMYACMANCFEIIDTLLQNNANITLKNKNDRSVFDIINTMKKETDRSKIRDLFNKHELLSSKN